MNFDRLCDLVLEAKAPVGFSVSDKIDYEEALSTIKSQKTIDILNIVKHNPNITLGQLAMKMGKTPQHIRPNLIKLMDSGYVQKGTPIKKVPIPEEKIPIEVREQLRDIAEEVDATIDNPTEDDYVTGVENFAKSYAKSPIAKRYVLNRDETTGEASVNTVKIKNDLKKMEKDGLLKKKNFSDEEEVPELEFGPDDISDNPFEYDKSAGAAYQDYQSSLGSEDY